MPSEMISEIVSRVLILAQWATLIYFLTINSFYVLLLAAACWELWKHNSQAQQSSMLRLLGSKVAPSISVLAPAFNEAATITDSVKGLLALYYPNLEIIVINDGSSDATLEILIQEFDLEPIENVYQRRQDALQTKAVVGRYRSRNHPNFVVVDKVNGGKADALNAGLNQASGQLVCAVDADTLIEPDAMQRMVRPFLARDDVLAAGGTIRVANGCTVRGGRVVATPVPHHFLAGFQVLEYLRAFLFGRLGWNRLGGNLVISGAFGLFRSEAVVDIGGYAHDAIGEDMELIMRLRTRSYERKVCHRVEFIPDPVAWTQVPESLRALGGQRDRWHRGLAEVIWRYRRALLNPRYGALGMVVFPYFLFVELLAPAVEALGLLVIIAGFALGIVNLPFASLFLLVAYGYGLILTASTLVMEEVNYHRHDGFKDRLLLVTWAIILENFGYRQLTVFWRLKGLVRFVLGRTDWGAIERQRFNSPEAQPDTANLKNTPVHAPAWA